MQPVYNEAWQKRFAFFEQYGTRPSAPAFKQALKPLPFHERCFYRYNFFAFCLGMVLFFVWGIWRKNLVLIAAFCVIDFGGSWLIDLGFRDNISIHSAYDQTVLCLFGLIYAAIANRAFYLQKIKHSTSWNPFET